MGRALGFCKVYVFIYEVGDEYVGDSLFSYFLDLGFVIGCDGGAYDG